MKNFFKILGKTILWIILGILVILGIFLIIIRTKGFNFCFNSVNNENNKICYNFKLNMNEKTVVKGRIREFNRLNGFRNGLQTYHYKNGNIGIKCYYKDGEPDGEFIGYYKNGQIMGSVNYIDGNENGKYVIYYKNGNILLEGNYNNGKKVGIWTGYSENGDINYVYNHDNGKFIYNNEKYDVSDLKKEKFTDLLLNEIHSE